MQGLSTQRRALTKTSHGAENSELQLQCLCAPWISQVCAAEPLPSVLDRAQHLSECSEGANCK